MAEDANTLVLIHMDGDNNGTTLVDKGTLGLTVSAYGDATTDTGTKKFGASSLNVFSGGTNGYAACEIAGFPITYFDHSFSFDCWFKFGQISTGYSIDFMGNSGTHYASIVNSAGTPLLYLRGNASHPDVSTYIDGNWHHFALNVYINPGNASDEVNTVYFDGTQFFQAACVSTFWPTIGNSYVYVGYYGKYDEVGSHNWIDEVRISGVERYSGNFTPNTSAYDDPVVVLTPSTLASTAVSTVAATGTMYATAGKQVGETPHATESVNIGLVVFGDGYLETELLTFSSVGATSVVGNFIASSDVVLFTSFGSTDCIATMYALSDVTEFNSTGITDLVGEVNAQCDYTQFSAFAITGIIGDSQCITEKIVFLSTGIISVTGSMQVSIPELSYYSLGIIDILGRLQVICENPIVYFLDAKILSTATYCLNLIKKGLVSTFSNYNFSSFATINNTVLGSNNTGLYKLTGNLDIAETISSKITFPLGKFGTTHSKQVRAVKLLAKTDGDIVITIRDGADKEWEKTVTTVASSLVETIVAMFPYTTEGRVIQVEISNVSGSYFMFDTIELLFFIVGRQ